MSTNNMISFFPINLAFCGLVTSGEGSFGVVHRMKEQTRQKTTIPQKPYPSSPPPLIPPAFEKSGRE